MKIVDFQGFYCANMIFEPSSCWATQLKLEIFLSPKVASPSNFRTRKSRRRPKLPPKVASVNPPKLNRVAKSRKITILKTLSLLSLPVCYWISFEKIILTFIIFFTRNNWITKSFTRNQLVFLINWIFLQNR